MRASSWLYQYSSQTKFAYGICSTGQTHAGPYGHHEYARPGALSHESEAPSPAAYAVADDVWKERPSVKLENEYAPTPAPAKGPRPPEDAEPVDMSINSSSEHPHSLNFAHCRHNHKAQKCNVPPAPTYRSKFIQFPAQFPDNSRK